MWFLFSCLAILCWAGSDFFTKAGTKSDDKLSQWRIVMVVGLVMGLHATCFMLITGTKFELISMLKYAPVSFMYILSMIFGYMGLRYIYLSVSSPICNSSGAVTALLCFLVLRQSMETMQLVAVGIISVGIVLLSVFERQEDKELHMALEQPANKRFSKSFLAILFPLLYCIIDGVGSFADAWVLENILDEAQANIAYEYTFLLVGVIAFIYVVLIRREKISFKDYKMFGIGAVCETAGQFFYIYALSANAIVAAPLISSYSVVSVLLSRLFLKEKLKARQYVVIAMVIAGIAVLGFFDA